MPKRKIPNFDSLDQAVTFWETHSFADYADDTEAVDVTVNLRPKALQIELQEPVARQVQDLAHRRRKTPSRLVQDWVEEQLRREEQGT